MHITRARAVWTTAPRRVGGVYSMRMFEEWVLVGLMQMLGGIGVLRSLNAMMELGASPFRFIRYIMREELSKHILFL
jgi:hypothetical protein